MTFFGVNLLTAIATVVLAVFAVVTAAYAARAFGRHSREVSDQTEVLGLQRRQLAEQEKTSAKQTEVLELQARELRAALDERKGEAEERRQGQAAQVAAWFAAKPVYAQGEEPWGALVRNASGLPVYDVHIGFYYIREPDRGRPWEPVSHGTSIETVRLIPPGDERHILIPADVRAQLAECNDEVYAVGVTFTDAAGNRWERDPRGALKPL